MKEHIIDFFSTLPDGLATFFVAMIPITELRASIPFAILKLDMPPIEAFVYSVLGNVFAGVLVLIFVENVLHVLLNCIGPLKNFWEKYIHRIHTKNKDKFEKWGAVALVTFVAIPLPLTGIVTGAVAASIFQIPFRKAIPFLVLGSIIAGIFVTFLTIGTDFLI
ncbi:MAG: ligand-binding protein SH3 [Candidatus Moraniibacteriota bacterium]|nr:MAG: ligand-binding protein SH3 [Candidatus Moranbacteria bacterium]